MDAAYIAVFYIQANIVCPNKHTAQAETMYKGHLLESETYIGGKVEALESGVFRSDLPMRFKCKPEAYQVLCSQPSPRMLMHCAMAAMLAVVSLGCC